jgi:hypothetical protein
MSARQSCTGLRQGGPTLKKMAVFQLVDMIVSIHSNSNDGG